MLKIAQSFVLYFFLQIKQLQPVYILHSIYYYVKYTNLITSGVNEIIWI